MISEYFGKEKKMYKIINVDEAVAYGAAIQASLLNDEKEEGLDELILVDVCPLSLGTGVEGGLMSVIIPRNTPIPCEKTVGYVTVKDDQDYFRIGIYEGEREFYYDNSQLDSYYIGNLTKAPRGDLCIKDFELNVLYPRLDINVSKHINHLLKSPFCIHPKTGLVSVPLDENDIRNFKIEDIPKLDQLVEDFNNKRVNEKFQKYINLFERFARDCNNENNKN